MIGLYGGSFDPVHIGHLRIAEDIREFFSLEKIIFIPAYHSPLKPESRASPEDRVKMLKISTAYNKRFFDVSDLEIKRGGKSYTVETANYFVNILGYYPAFICGTDSFLSLHKWKEPYRLINLLNFIVVGRGKSTFEEVKEYIERNFPEKEVFYNRKYIDKNRTSVYFFDGRKIDISSTEIRRRIKENKSITYLVLPEVEYYINKKNLYRG